MSPNEFENTESKATQAREGDDEYTLTAMNEMEARNVNH